MHKYIHCGRITRLDGLLNKDGWGGEEIKEGEDSRSLTGFLIELIVSFITITYPRNRIWAGSVVVHI